MEKIETQNLQREIKAIIKALGWSVPKFASSYLIDINDRDVPEDEILSFIEKVKKQLIRRTTKVELLREYLSYIKGLDSYSNLHLNKGAPEFQPLNGLFDDYPIILREEPNDTYRKVLEVAAAYALSIGSAWSFNVIPIYTSDNDDRSYIVIWEGDVGHNNGSGTWGPAMCEVSQSHFGSLFVHSAEHWFETTLRCIDEVCGFEDGCLILKGRRYDNDDVNNHPSLNYLVKLRKNLQNEWSLDEEKFLGKKYL
ncbi:hypothetical protein [Vibrio vulnificus]|uniref:hypothetical protein n=1 Tax=Vibrio vulnificus TaxID=672 RepID=UPI00307E4BD1